MNKPCCLALLRLNLLASDCARHFTTWIVCSTSDLLSAISSAKHNKADFSSHATHEDDMLPAFNHIDFVYGRNAPQLYEIVIDDLLNLSDDEKQLCD